MPKPKKKPATKPRLVAVKAPRTPKVVDIADALKASLKAAKKNVPHQDGPCTWYTHPTTRERVDLKKPIQPEDFGKDGPATLSFDGGHTKRVIVGSMDDGCAIFRKQAVKVAPQLVPGLSPSESAKAATAPAPPTAKPQLVVDAVTAWGIKNDYSEESVGPEAVKRFAKVLDESKRPRVSVSVELVGTPVEVLAALVSLVDLSKRVAESK